MGSGTFEKQPFLKRTMAFPHLLARQANPVLFAVIMGTGSVSILFAAFPYGRDSGMMLASLVWFFLNLFLFCTFTALSVVKYSAYPDQWSKLVRNPVTSLYLGTFPMGATTLLSVALEVIHRYYGFGSKHFVYAIWSLWCVDVAVSVACAWPGVHMMFVRHTHTLATMNSMWLLPVVTLIVASSAGQVIAADLLPYSPYYALLTAAISAFMVTIGLSLALMILTIYLARLVIHGLPPTGAILSVFLPLGPTGQAGFSIYLFGVNMHKMLPYHDAGESVFLSSPFIGEIIYALCVATAFVLWSLATMWLAYGLLALKTTLFKSRPNFKMGFWGIVFPNGVYANLTLNLAEAFDSVGLRVWGSMYAVIVLCLWTGMALRSLVALKQMSGTKPIPSMESKGEEESEQELPMNGKRDPPIDSENPVDQR